MSLSWLQWALLAAVAFGIQVTVNKIILEKGLTPVSMVTLLFTITSVMLWIYFGATEKFSFQITNNLIILLLLASLVTAIGFVTGNKAVEISQNPGYPLAVWSSSIIITTFLSIFLFRLNFEFIHILGVLLIFMGIVFLSGAIKV